MNNKIQKVLTDENPGLILGDLNVDFNRPNPTVADNFARSNWKDLFESHQDLINGRTTHKSHDAMPSSIDHIVTNLTTKIEIHQIDEITSKKWSDHNIFEFRWPIVTKMRPTREHAWIKKKLKHIRGPSSGDISS